VAPRRIARGRLTASGGRDTIIFDLSEVLIAGLAGVERKLAGAIGVKQETILPELGGEPLRQLCRGVTSEDEYLGGILQRTHWGISPEQLKNHIRANFHWKVGGMRECVADLAQRYGLCLYSDHAREWVAYLTEIHPFLSVFPAQVYSYDIGLIKTDPEAFTLALERLGRTAARCVFVDDNERNVQAARASGVCAIQFFSRAALQGALAAQGFC